MIMSSMAMRLWMNQAKLVASRPMPASVAKRRPLAHQIVRPKANRPNAPNSAEGMRQTSGLSPSSQIAAAMISLPSIGCSELTASIASSLRAAGT